MISSFCLYLSFSWDGRILKKTSLILTTYYLELGLNIHGWKNHYLTTVSAARPQNSLRAPCCAQHEEKRKLKGPRTHIRRHWSARHRHARASEARRAPRCAAYGLVRACLESETTAVRFHLEIRSSCTRARAWSGGPVNLSAATRAASMNMIRKCSKSSAVYLNW